MDPTFCGGRFSTGRLLVIEDLIRTKRGPGRHIGDYWVISGIRERAHGDQGGRMKHKGERGKGSQMLGGLTRITQCAAQSTRSVQLCLHAVCSPVYSQCAFHIHAECALLYTQCAAQCTRSVQLSLQLGQCTRSVQLSLQLSQCTRSVQLSVHALYSSVYTQCAVQSTRSVQLSLRAVCSSVYAQCAAQFTRSVQISLRAVCRSVYLKYLESIKI